MNLYWSPHYLPKRMHFRNEFGHSKHASGIATGRIPSRMKKHRHLSISWTIYIPSKNCVTVTFQIATTIVFALLEAQNLPAET